ncbi:MAG: glycosyltransferase [Duncaniella sp.]|uniref:glycosyltransferase family 2 protein n=1 Tax=Duncaniella sp. TaxID=2518496 RepID=UPI0023C80B57|nr:glycosyltransferase family 2 protein [Duncaniella sp.]MDE5988246.1 glycosyltransferase [Duncaniella sp.]
MKISVIVPVYNVERFVEECLRSVIEQDFSGEMECIVVDDCGSDGSMAVVKRLTEAYSGPIEFLIVRHESNRGLSAARNSGIGVATGRYVTFLDSDDRLLPGAIAAMAAVAEKHPGTDIVQGDMWLKNPNRFMDFLCVSPVLFPEYNSDRRWCSRSLLTEIPMTAWGKLIRRDFITSNSLYFCEGLLHEDDMWRVCASRHIGSVAFCFRPVYFYRNDNEGSIIHRKDKTHSFYSRLRIIENLIENFGSADFAGECSYLFRAMNFIHKAQAWPQISDKRLISQELGKLNCLARRAPLPELFKFMARYLTLSPAVGDSIMMRPFYQSYINRYYNRLPVG